MMDIKIFLKGWGQGGRPVDFFYDVLLYYFINVNYVMIKPLYISNFIVVHCIYIFYTYIIYIVMF